MAVAMLVEGILNNEDVTAVLGSSWLEIDVVWATNEDETPVAPEESGKAVPDDSGSDSNVTKLDVKPVPMRLEPERDAEAEGSTEVSIVPTEFTLVTVTVTVTVAP